MVRWPEQTDGKLTPRVLVYLQPDKANLVVIRSLQALGADVIAVLPEVRPEAVEQLGNRQTQLFAHPVRLAGLLARASLVVSNAGHGVTAVGLLAGVPQLLIPRNVEQQLFARRVAATGAAHVLSIEHMTECVGSAIKDLLEDRFVRGAAEAFAREYTACTQEHVLATVVNAIENARPRVEMDKHLTHKLLQD